MEADGIVSPITEVACKYKSPTKFQEIISVEVFVIEITPLRLRFGYTMKVGERLVCTAESTSCFIENGKLINICDTHQIIKAEFPVFYEYRTSNGSLGRCLITHYQIPVKIGNVTVKPGDVVLGDIDGVLIVPRAIAYDVLLRAEEIKENEKKIFSWVKEGQSIQDIKEKGGYF